MAQFFDPAAFSAGNSGLPEQSPVRDSGAPQVNVQASFQPQVTPADGRALAQKQEMDQATINALTKMGENLIRPAIEQEQQAQFLQGAQRQMEGEALTSIIDSQPWYTKIFGPSASVQGARKIAEMASVDGVVNGMAADMGQLRALSSDEFYQELQNRTKSSLTGDSGTDTLIQMHVLESSQALIKAHTKEHYAWTQEQMSAQYTNAALAKAQQLQLAAQAHVRGTLSDEEFNQAKLQAASSLQPLAGQDQKSYFQSVKDAGKEAMQTGNWHFVDLIEKTGIVNAMPSKERQQWRDDKREAEQKGLSDLALGDYHIQLATMAAESQAGKISPNAVLNQVAAINNEVQQKTGLMRPMISAQDTETLIKGNLTGIFNAQEKARDRAMQLAEKRQEAIEKDRLVMMGIATGQAGNLAGAGAASRTDMQSVGTAILRTQMQQGNNGWLPLVANNFNQGGFKFDYIESQMQGGLRGSEGEDYNPAWQHSFDVYSKLNSIPGGHAAAAAYAGEYAGKLQETYEAVHSGLPPDLAYQRIFQRPAAADLPKKSMQEVQEAIKDRINPGFFERILGSSKSLDDASVQAIADAAAPVMQKYRGTSLTADEQLTRAWAQIQPQFDVVGTHVIRKYSDQPSVANIVRTNAKEAGDIFDQTLNTKLSSLGLEDPEHVNIQQINGLKEPTYLVEAYKDGALKYFQITPEELRKGIADDVLSRQNHSSSSDMPDYVPSN